ncbi:hypothetical protein G7Y89_g4259 [Cudoniella acicularis]|uniref:Enoyl reductase (ER) domain-containing protein n=1 Tax=Cudoniella acicularis TaxID=354080 RepID=A0A8H4RPU7_9HELO|nr:hypothetical protein G7Y89_g4259 [Cudoniella acicularis]
MAMPKTMKALYSTISSTPTSTTPATLALADRPIPTLASNTALVRVHAAGINPSDFANGALNRFNAFKPIIPGRDFAGTVVQAASRPELLGTDVYGTSGNQISLTCDGTHAEYIAVPFEGLVPKPEGLSWTQAGVVGVPYTTAYMLLERLNAFTGKDVILVLGATGTVGKAVVEIAKAKGCKTITASRRDGCDVNLTVDPELEAAKVHNDGNGPDVIIDCVGSPALMEKGLAILGRRGRYGFISGMRGGGPEIKVNTMRMFSMDQSLTGLSSLSPILAEASKVMELLRGMFNAGAIHALPEEKITKISIEEAKDAYQEAAKLEGKKFAIAF